MNSQEQQCEEEVATALDIQPIAYISSCYQEKFGIPRQPGLVTEARATLAFVAEYDDPDMVRGLEEFSHLWLVFLFHASADSGWKPLVRPPRLGGNAKKGVFATRSMFRPNPIGLSVVVLENVRTSAAGVELELSGIDLLDGTPVLDIKPYLPYADSPEGAQGGFAASAPFIGTVVFSHLASEQCVEKSAYWQVDVKQLITQTLAQDPRPAYRKGVVDTKGYGMQLYDFDVRWCCLDGRIEVIELANRA